MIKRIKEWLSSEYKGKVGRPKLATENLIKAAKIEAVLAFVLCFTIALAGAGVLTQKNPLELLGIANSKLLGDVNTKKQVLNKVCPTGYEYSTETECKKIFYSYKDKQDILKQDGTKCFDNSVKENKNYDGVVYRNKREISGRYCYDKYVYEEKCDKDYFKYGSRCRKTIIRFVNKVCPQGYVSKSDTECELENNN